MSEETSLFSETEDGAEKATCERCGAPALVHVLEDYVQGRPVRRSLCARCADQAYEEHLRLVAWPGRRKLNLGAAAMITGALLAVLGASADWFGVQGHEGFGLHQRIGTGLGALILIAGALLRIDLLAAFGAATVLTAALADFHGLMGSPGVGWRQRTLILIGLIMMLIVMRRRKEARADAKEATR